MQVETQERTPVLECLSIGICDRDKNYGIPTAALPFANGDKGNVGETSTLSEIDLLNIRTQAHKTCRLRVHHKARIKAGKGYPSPDLQVFREAECIQSSTRLGEATKLNHTQLRQDLKKHTISQVEQVKCGLLLPICLLQALLAFHWRLCLKGVFLVSRASVMTAVRQPREKLSLH